MTNEVGAKLKALREACGVTGRGLAERLKCSQSYVSKMETGALHPSRVYVEKFVAALPIPAASAAALFALLEFYETEHHPIDDDTHALARRQDAFASIERTAAVIRSFHAFAVPGLLQTRAYMERVFAYPPGHPHSDREAALRRRVERQKILQSKRRRFTFLLSEAALRNRVCGAADMRVQIEHLKECARRRNLRILFLPWATSLPVLAPTSFMIFDDALVLIDTINGFISFRRSADVATHADAFEKLQRQAVAGAQFDAALDRVLADYSLTEPAPAK